MSEDRWAHALDQFLDAVAAKKPTPGGGAVAGAAAALACATGRMVAAYSPGKNADPEAIQSVAELAGHLERAERLARALVDEDARAYDALTEASRRLKQGPGRKAEYDTALAVATAVPLQIAGTGCESLSLLERLLPLANRHLVSDVGVAAVLAEAAVRAASHMVYVNAEQLDDAESRQQTEHETDQLIARAHDALARLEAALDDQL